MADDTELRDFWIASLLVQLHAVDRSQRSSGRWRMSISTMNLLRRITGPGGYHILPVPTSIDGPMLLLGCPIELDETAEGATFELAEAVSRG